MTFIHLFKKLKKKINKNIKLSCLISIYRLLLHINSGAIQKRVNFLHLWTVCQRNHTAFFVLRWCTSYCNPMPITHALKSFDLAMVCSTFRTNKTSHVLLVHFISSGHAKYCNEKLYQQSVGSFITNGWLTGKRCIAHKKLTSSLVFAANKFVNYTRNVNL